MSDQTKDGVRLTGALAAERYVDLLTGNPNEELLFRVFSDNRRGSALAKNLSGTLQSLSNVLSAAQANGCGVFAVVNEGGHRDEEISQVRAVFIDADGVSLEATKWHLPPDFIAYRSDAHWHAYWLVTGIEVQQFSEVQKRLAEHYGTDASVHNLSRVMRIPGFMHLKDPSNPEPYVLIDQTDGALGDCRRDLNGYGYPAICNGLPLLKAEPTTAPVPESGGTPITFNRFREMLSYIDPTLKSQHSKWAGMTIAIIHDLPIVDDEPIDREHLADEWNSGQLWRERTGDDAFVVETYIDRDEMLRSAAGKPRVAGSLITLGTFAQMARAGGFRGPVSDEMAIFDMLGGAPSVAIYSQTQPDVFPAYFVKELESLPEPRWLIEGLIPEDALCIFYGATNSLKTFFALDVVLSAAAKKKWAQYEGDQGANLDGFKISRPLRAAFIAGEGARGLRKRVRAWQIKHKMENEDLPIIVIPMMPRFASEADAGKLIRTIQTKLGSVDLVIVDTAMRAASGLNLNLPADSQVLVDACDRIRQELGASVVLIHHTGKDKEKGPLGAENLKAAVNTVERVDLIDSSPGKRTIRVTQEKSKDSDQREPIYLNATNQIMGTDGDGNEVSSLVLSRCTPTGGVKVSLDAIRLGAALRVIREHGGESGISTRALVDRMAKILAPEPLSEEATKKLTETLRKWVEGQVRQGGSLHDLAFRDGDGETAARRFLDRAFVLPALAAEQIG